MTVAGISGTAGGEIENTEGEWGPNNGTLIVNNTLDCSYSGTVRNSAGGSGSLSLVKTGNAKLTLTNVSNSYTGSTTISAGAVEADSGVGLPTASYLILDGGVFQGNGTVTFTRNLGGSGSGNFQWTANGGGFSAGVNPLTVNVGGNASPSTLLWNTSGNNIKGTLKLGSLSALNVVDFQNGINLNGANRTVQVDDNPSSGTDYADISGKSLSAPARRDSSKRAAASWRCSPPATITTAPRPSAPASPSGQRRRLAHGKFSHPRRRRISRQRHCLLHAKPGNLGNGNFQWTANGGGFSAGVNPLPVNIAGNATPTTVAWGTTLGSGIVGTLKFGSPTAANVVNFQNGIDLGGADRTIQVNDNPYSTADYAKISGVMLGSGGIVKTGNGLLALIGPNVYTGNTTITGGALQAAVAGAGIPANSLLKLDGGVFHANNGSETFTRSLGSSGGAVEWTANGGGFSAGAGTLTVNLGGNATPSTLTWGSTVGSQIVGTLKFGSAFAANLVDFRNGINLDSGVHTIQVDDNLLSPADSAKSRAL